MLIKVSKKALKKPIVKQQLRLVNLQIFKVVLICIFGALTSNGSPIIYNHHQYNHPNSYSSSSVSRGYLTPPRAITTLNTFVPRALIPPAPPRTNVPRVYETPKPKMYTAPAIFRTTQSPPTTKRPYVNKQATYNHNLSNNHNNINPRYAYNYSVNDNRVSK